VTLVAGVFVASLLGSIHCAAMCGAFVCTYVGTSAGQRADMGRTWWTHGAYHAGRLVSYGLLGALAGSIGAGVDRMGALAGASRGAAILGGSLMVLWAASTIAASMGLKTGVAAPAWTARALGAAIARVRETSPVARAGAVGLLTTLLPCGWLYVFVATAAGTGSAFAGAQVMAIFWLGTVPVLLAVGLGAQRLFGRFARRLPIASAVFVLMLGVLAIAGRMRAPGGAGMHDHAQMEHAR
jgi:sulfite exporter TauE/SafE